MPDSSTPSDRAPKYGGLTLDELKDKHRWAPSEVSVTVDDERAETGIDFYEAAYAALLDLLSAVSSLGASLDAAEAEAKKYREALEDTLAAGEAPWDAYLARDAMFERLRAALGDTDA